MAVSTGSVVRSLRRASMAYDFESDAKNGLPLEDLVTHFIDVAEYCNCREEDESASSDSAACFKTSHHESVPAQFRSAVRLPRSVGLPGASQAQYIPLDGSPIILFKTATGNQSSRLDLKLMGIVPTWMLSDPSAQLSVLVSTVTNIPSLGYLML